MFIFYTHKDARFIRKSILLPKKKKKHGTKMLENSYL